MVSQDKALQRCAASGYRKRGEVNTSLCLSHEPCRLRHESSSLTAPLTGNGRDGSVKLEPSPVQSNVIRRTQPLTSHSSRTADRAERRLCQSRGVGQQACGMGGHATMHPERIGRVACSACPNPLLLARLSDAPLPSAVFTGLWLSC